MQLPWGFWSLLRSWLRPHRGISQEHLPLYLAFFEFVHNIRRRGKALLESVCKGTRWAQVWLNDATSNGSLPHKYRLHYFRATLHNPCSSAEICLTKQRYV